MIAHNARGVEIRTGGNGNRVQGNTIRDNSFAGVAFNTSSNIIEANTIHGNGQDGVLAIDGTGNQITRNSISGNTGLGINLLLDGVTGNDDGDTPGITVNPTSGLTTTEAGGTAQFTVRLNTVPTADATIALSSSDTTEGTVSPSSLTFTPANAQTAQTGTVTGQQDTIADGNVACTIVTGAATSSDPNCGGRDPADVAVTNTDDEVAPGLSISDATVAEGDAGTSTLTFTVTLNPPSSQQVTVPFVTADQTATGGAACAANADYVAASGTLTFIANDTSETVTVAVCADTLSEGNETLAVNLGTPTGGATVADGQGVGTITDDDLAGGLAFPSATAQAAENGGSVTLTVQRTGPGIAAAGLPAGSAPTSNPPGGNVPSGSIRPNPSASPAVPGGGTVAPSAVSAVTVQYATTNGTATAGQDYTATLGTLSFGVGETTKTITIPILSDAVDEVAETFTVTLSNPSGGATLGTPSTATVTISEVDTTPCQTFLTASIPAGTNVLPVISQTGCSVGDTVAIDPGQPNEDRGTILGFGSIVVQQQTSLVLAGHHAATPMHSSTSPAVSISLTLVQAISGHQGAPKRARTATVRCRRWHCP